nr:MAG TPA: hypothetical protein [Caudoviricetes sp.]
MVMYYSDSHCVLPKVKRMRKSPGSSRGFLYLVVWYVNNYAALITEVFSKFHTHALYIVIYLVSSNENTITYYVFYT